MTDEQLIKFADHLDARNGWRSEQTRDVLRAISAAIRHAVRGDDFDTHPGDCRCTYHNGNG
jgi:hypothetical protein